MQREDIDLSFQNIGRNDGYSSSRLGRRREDRRNHPLPQEGDLLSITDFNQRAEEMRITIALPDRAAYPREVTSIRTLEDGTLECSFLDTTSECLGTGPEDLPLPSYITAYHRLRALAVDWTTPLTLGFCSLSEQE